MIRKYLLLAMLATSVGVATAQTEKRKTLSC